MHFGTFSTAEGYPRNRVIADALQQAGVEVVPCRIDAWGSSGSRAATARFGMRAVATAVRLGFAWIRLSWRYLVRSSDHDVLIVGYPGFLDIHLARFLSRFKGRPLIVLDAFLSLHEAVVDDRRLVPPGSLRARLLELLDTLACQAADVVLLDTETHIRFHASLTGQPPAKFVRAFVGSDPRLPLSRDSGSEPGRVLFFGAFLRLHGADVIVRAAALLAARSAIGFTLVGDGPMREECVRLAGESASNIRWVKGFLGYADLSEEIKAAEICLGIFSDSPKAGRVIPCKIFNILASGKPLITAYTPAATELLVHDENAILVPPGDPEALADAILRLTLDSRSRNRIAEGGRTLFETRLTTRAIGEDLAIRLQDALDQRARSANP